MIQLMSSGFLCSTGLLLVVFLSCNRLVMVSLIWHRWFNVHRVGQQANILFPFAVLSHGRYSSTVSRYAGEPAKFHFHKPLAYLNYTSCMHNVPCLEPR